jgi:PBP1b-binding outer membrane lipoprotein LpoB
MNRARLAARLAGVAAAAFIIASCGQSKAPKVDAATERAQALERAKKGPYGAQVQSLETAKSMQDDINRKAQQQVDQADKDAK